MFPQTKPIIEILDDIRQYFVFAESCELLSPYIEFFAESPKERIPLDNNTHLLYRLFESYTPTFFINLTDSYLLKLHNETYKIDEGQDILILRDTRVERFNSIDDNIFTVKFYPGALGQFFDISTEQIKNSITFLNTILPQQLLEDIRNAPNFEIRKHLISNYLLKQLDKNNDCKLRVVNDAIQKFKTNDMLLSVQEMAEEVNVSPKTLTRYFSKELGVPPKKYLSMVRFRKALTNYVHVNDTFDPFNYGYYDHSHFGKDVVKFTGKKLTQSR